MGVTQRYNTEFSISPETINGVPYNSFTNLNYYYITISSNTSWSIVSGDNWLSFNANSGSGSTTISLLVSDNSGSARTGTVVFEDANGIQRTLTVNQVASDAQVETISVSPASLSFASSGESRVFVITTDAEWNISYPEWVTLSQDSGSGTTTVTATTSANTGSNRIGQIRAYTSNDSSLIVARQEGYSVEAQGSINPIELQVPFYSYNYQIYVTSNVAWELESNQNFVSFSPSTGMTGTSIPVTVSVSQNSGSTDRVAELILKNRLGHNMLDYIELTQAEYETPDITISNRYLSFPCTGGTTYYVPYTSNVIPTIRLAQGNSSVISATVDSANNRFVITTPDFGINGVGTFDGWFQIGLNGNYAYENLIYFSIDACCQELLTATTEYYVSAAGVTNLFQINPATIKSITVDGNSISVDDLIQITPSAEVYGYYFTTTGSHTVVTTTTKVYSHNGGIYDMYAIVSSNIEGSKSTFNGTYATDDYGYCQNLTELSVSASTPSCSAWTTEVYFPSCIGCTSLEHVYMYDMTKVWKRAFSGSSVNDIWCYGMVAPQIVNYGSDGPGTSFEGMQSTGTLHVPSGADYSTWEAALPSGWSIVYNA